MRVVAHSRSRLRPRIHLNQQRRSFKNPLKGLWGNSQQPVIGLYKQVVDQLNILDPAKLKAEQQAKEQAAANQKEDTDQQPQPVQNPAIPLFDTLSKQAKTYEQQRFVKEIRRGNLWEFHQVSRSKGKPFKAEKVIGTNAKKFPVLTGKSHASGKEVTLTKEFSKNDVNVLIFTQKRSITKFMVDSWKEPIRKAHPDIPIYELLVSRHHAYRGLYPLLWWHLRQLPETEKPNVIWGIPPPPLHRWDLDPLVLGIDVENSYLSFVFVLDRRGIIRWRAVGKAEEGELKDLSTVISELKLKAQQTAPKYVNNNDTAATKQQPTNSNSGKQATKQKTK